MIDPAEPGHDNVVPSVKSSKQGKRPMESGDGEGRKNPENLTIPATLHFKGTAATDFVASIFCRRFLRNVTAIMCLQFILISALILIATLQPKLKHVIRHNFKIVLIVNGVCYLVIAITLIFFNKLYRKIGVFNYIPLLIITVNISLLLCVPAAIFEKDEIVAITVMIAFYSCGMTLCQVLCNWELSLPSGIFGIILANTVFGSVTVGVLFHCCQFLYPAHFFFIMQLIATAVWIYILYDLELMTTEPGVQKLLEYGVLYDCVPYALLHVCVDVLDVLLFMPKYVYDCVTMRARMKMWYTGFVPRSGIGMSCGHKYREDETDSDQEDKQKK